MRRRSGHTHNVLLGVDVRRSRPLKVTLQRRLLAVLKLHPIHASVSVRGLAGSLGEGKLDGSFVYLSSFRLSDAAAQELGTHLEL